MLPNVTNSKREPCVVENEEDVELTLGSTQGCSKSFTWPFHSTLFITLSFNVLGASLIVQLVKNLPTMQETPVRFLGREDLLEEGMATHSSLLGLPLWLRW